MLSVIHNFSIILIMQIVKRDEDEMGYSQAQKAESRKRVLDTAAKQIREGGIEALGVADCMRSAGLTHGAFYGHFASRDALIVEALQHAMTGSEDRLAALENGASAGSQTALQSIADSYLSERHVKDPGAGCALCALAGDATHAIPGVREVYTEYLRRFAARLAKAAVGGNSEIGLGIAATIVGAITLARAVDDPKLAQSILSAAHAIVMSQEQGEEVEPAPDSEPEPRQEIA
jgi:TetR/AcrR family transcriptional regulator, transcriptional repressor for nem operon